MNDRLRSSCCNAGLLFQHPLTKLFVGAYATDPTFTTFAARGGVPRCYRCNRPEPGYGYPVAR